MSFSITLGWWMIPLIATIAAFVWAFTRPYQTGVMFPDPSPIFYAGGALIVSLFAWLIWALAS